MCTAQINCYHPVSTTSPSFTFYLLSKGENAGKPCLSPWVNCFAIHCEDKEALDFYFWLSYSLWQTGRFKPYLRGSVIPFISVGDVRKLLTEVAGSIYPHWHHLQGVIQALNQLKTARAHLAQCIISNEKLQQMLLNIYF